MNPPHPDPDALLRTARREARGRLKVFLGAAPGVGKTYEMLSDAAQRREAGCDVVIGLVETHGRRETEARTAGFAFIPRREVAYQGRVLTELDLDAVLARRPGLVLVDELAHTNAPGCRHDKRWQDVEELRDAGIEVYSTLNIQHVESLNDVVASFTRIRVRETVPDHVLDDAEIEIVDIPPDELIERLRAGKVYVPDEASRALGHFFSKSNLSALRELALRRAAQVVDAQVLELVRGEALAGVWGSGERIVVAVSEQPEASELVRVARRLAEALRATWTAVHVETPRSLRLAPVDRVTLSANLALAARLGGRVQTIPAANVVDGLRSAVAETRATQLVIGKSVRSRWFELRHGSVVDQIVRSLPGVAVHVASSAAAHRQPGANDPVPRQHRLVDSSERLDGLRSMLPGVVAGLILAGLVTLAGYLITSIGSITNVALLYLLPVMVAATRHGLRPALVTALVSSLAYNFFFIPPLYTFTIEDPENIITVLVLFGVAVVASQLASRTREQAHLAEARALQNATLAGFARQLAGVGRREELARLLCGEVARLLGAQTVLFVPRDGQLMVEAAVPATDGLDVLAMAAAQWAADKARPAGSGTDTLTASEWRFQPIITGERVHAVMGVAGADADRAIRPDQAALLFSLLDQAALAFERVVLEEQMAGVAKVVERDRLRAALLSSVSHDLRTPLTTVLGVLREIIPATPRQLEQLTVVRTESERIDRFIANLLDMVRIESGALQRTLEPVDLAEAAAAAAHDLRALFNGAPVVMSIPPDLPLVRVDARLLHHCLINLIDNAIKYSPAGAPIELAAARRRDGIVLSVIDRGPGLPPDRRDDLFQAFTRIDMSDRKGGTGLGLAIVKGFAEAMGLTVAAANRDDGPGARFDIVFPEAVLFLEADQA